MLRIGCFTGVRGRELFLRQCLLQMAVQTRPPDRHLVLLNGEDAATYDRRLIIDLLRPSTLIEVAPWTLPNREVSTLAVERLLEFDLDIFCKIDSDDVYFANYLATIAEHIEASPQLKPGDGFCVNLSEQLRIHSAGGNASIHAESFRNGLGLTAAEQQRGVRVGAPPTYAFDRKAAELLVLHSRRPPYNQIRSDDIAWRTILFDHGITIDCLATPQPVIGYVRHGSNTCRVPGERFADSQTTAESLPETNATPFERLPRVEVEQFVRKQLSGETATRPPTSAARDRVDAVRVTVLDGEDELLSVWITDGGLWDCVATGLGEFRREQGNAAERVELTVARNLKLRSWHPSLSQEILREGIHSPTMGLCLRLRDEPDSARFFVGGAEPINADDLDELIDEFCRVQELADSQKAIDVQAGLFSIETLSVNVADERASRDTVQSATHQRARINVMFLNAEFGVRRTGIENAALLRSRLFAKELDVLPQLLTVKYDPNLTLTRSRLLGQKWIDEAAQLQNIYEFYQQRESVSASGDRLIGEGPRDPDWQIVAVSDTCDSRVFDSSGELILYEKRSRQTGRLQYINHIHEGRLWRRDTFDCDGWLSRIEHIDVESCQTLFEMYLRPDGSPAIFQFYTVESGRRELAKISLLDRDGLCSRTFSSQTAWRRHWLGELTEDPTATHVMIVDRNRIYYEAAEQVKASLADHRVKVVPVIHAIHTKNAFDIASGATNENYVDVLKCLGDQDAVVVATQRQRDDIAGRYGDGNVRVIPHAMDVELEGGHPSGDGMSAGSPPDGRSRRSTMFSTPDGRSRRSTMSCRATMQIVYVGRYSVEKNHEAAIRVFAAIVEQIPDATLQLHGSGNRRGAIEQLLQSLKLESNVSVHPYAQDVNSIYRGAGLSLLTSRGEGFSLSVMESLCAGCPVAAFDVKYGPRELIEDNRTGLLVPFGEESQMSDRIIELLLDPPRHQKMCEDALADSPRFSPAETAKQWRQLLDDLSAE